MGRGIGLGSRREGSWLPGERKGELYRLGNSNCIELDITMSCCIHWLSYCDSLMHCRADDADPPRSALTN